MATRTTITAAPAAAAYRVYYGPHLKACCDTPVEAGNYAKFLFLTRVRGLVRGQGLPVRIYSPSGCSIKYGDKR